jgi:glycosyltransferase involved in cell wall biosynthesis
VNNCSDATVSVVIPVYNDLQALEKAIPITLEVLESSLSSFEIIIAEDASTDGSASYAEFWQERDKRIRHLHRNERLGRGSALSAAAGLATGDIICYFDVDLATDMTYLPDLIKAVRNGADIATGSRLLPDSEITRSTNREIKSRGYNFLVRLILGSRLKDHQCGFKAFRRSCLLPILDEVSDTHWFWDTEVLIRAQRKRYKIIEIPVLWHEGPGTTVKRQDIWKMGKSILGLWWKIHVS